MKQIIYLLKVTLNKSIFELVAFALLVGLIFLLIHQAEMLPINYDEAYNLQVVDTLSKGGGYASYGALRGAKWLFDPYITTGPVVLFPMAVIWILSSESIWFAHIFMLTFFLAYLICIYGLFKRENDTKSPSIVAIAIALCLSITPGMVLGELPAAAMIIFAAWAISKDKPVIVGLAIGLAIQTKLVYGFAGLAMIITYFIALIAARNIGWSRNVLLAITFAILPTFLFELYRLYSFNGSTLAYINSLTEMKLFLQSQSINTQASWSSYSMLLTKWEGLRTFLPLGGWVALGIFSLYLFCCAAQSIRQGLREHITKVRMHVTAFDIAIMGLVLSGCTMLVIWIFFSKQTSDRQAVPFLLLTLPALGGWGAKYYYKLISSIKERSLTKAVSLTRLIAISLIMLIISAKIIGTVRKFPVLAISQKEQYTVANLVKHSKPSSVLVDGWWQNPEFLLLSKIKGLPIRTPTQSQLLIVQDYQVIANNSNWENYKQRCGGIIYASAKVLVCWL